MGRPKKSVEEVVPDTAAVSFWDMPEEDKVVEAEFKVEEQEEKPKEEFDFDDVYNNSADVDKILKKVDELNESEKAQAVATYQENIKSVFGKKSTVNVEPKEVEVKQLPKAEPKETSSIASLFAKKAESKPVEEIPLSVGTEEGKPCLDEVKEEEIITIVEKEDPKEVAPVLGIVEDVYKEEIEVPKSLIQQKAELTALTKTEMTKEQKQQLADIKAQEIVENTKVLDNSINKFKKSIDDAPNIDPKYYRDQLKSLRDSRPMHPDGECSPNELLNILNNVGRNIERISKLQGDLAYVFNLYEGMIDTIEDMWSVISLQSSEQTRRGEGAIQIADIKIAHNEVKGLRAAYNVELDTLKTMKDVCAEQIKLIQVQLKLGEQVIYNDYEGINC